MPKIAIATFGCKVNQYESACITEPFRHAGWEQVDFDEPADVYVINTCTVTGRTDFKSRNAVRKALAQKAERPGVRVFVTGCYAQRFPQEIEALGPVDAVIDNQAKVDIFACMEHTTPEFTDIALQTAFADAYTEIFPDHTRAFVKVQDGCDYFCAYCAVPHARGHSRSRPLASVLKQCELLVAAGHREIVLGGVNLGLWGREWGQTFADLLNALENVAGLDMLRISSIEPQTCDEPLFDYIRQSRKLVPHFHIPLQSGSDTLLQSMGRHYLTTEFRGLVDRLHALRPDIALGFDVIVGLPGETDALFAETVALLEELDFTYLHVFAYSKRPGTRAVDMPGQVHGTVIRERSTRLQEISVRKKRAYGERLIAGGVVLTGLIEDVKLGRDTALSDHYLRIYRKTGGSADGLLRGPALKWYRDGLEVGL